MLDKANSVYYFEVAGEEDKTIISLRESVETFLFIQAMILLSISLSRMSLQSVDEVGNAFLINKVLVGASSMNVVRQAVHDYDKELTLAINTLKCHMKMDISTKKDKIYNNIYPVEWRRVRKFFPRMGYCEGNIINVRKENNCNNYMMKFDGDNDDGVFWYQDEYNKYLYEESILVGDVSFRFIKTFKGGLFFSGRVISIEHNEKIKCKYD